MIYYKGEAYVQQWKFYGWYDNCVICDKINMSFNVVQKCMSVLLLKIHNNIFTSSCEVWLQHNTSIMAVQN